MSTDRERLLNLLKEKSFQRREVILASGRRSGFYIDCKQTALTAEGHYLIGRLVLDEIGSIAGGVDAVAGVTLGGDPLVSAVSLTSFVAGRPLPALIIRKELKGHGTEAWIEGMSNVKAEARVVMLEDVVTTGGSTLRACAKARDASALFVKSDFIKE